MPITVTDINPTPGADTILTDDALAFVEKLQRNFAATRDELLTKRATDREAAARTGRLDFLPEPPTSATGTGRSPRRPRRCATGGSR